MTTIDATRIDLTAIDATIAAHIHAYGRAANERASWEEDSLEEGRQASITAYHLFYAGDTEDELTFAYHTFADGFQLALELAAQVSESPFSPNTEAIGEIVTEKRERLALLFRDARDRISLPAQRLQAALSQVPPPVEGEPIARARYNLAGMAVEYRRRADLAADLFDKIETATRHKSAPSASDIAAAKELNTLFWGDEPTEKPAAMRFGGHHDDLYSDAQPHKCVPAQIEPEIHSAVTDLIKALTPLVRDEAANLRLLRRLERVARDIEQHPESVSDGLRRELHAAYVSIGERYVTKGIAERAKELGELAHDVKEALGLISGDEIPLSDGTRDYTEISYVELRRSGDQSVEEVIASNTCPKCLPNFMVGVERDIANGHLPTAAEGTQ